MVAAGGVTVTSALGVGNPECAGGLRQAVNECEGATLYVSAPPGASSGDFALISLHSIREDNTRNQPLHEDFYHFIPVGIYVP